MKAISILLLLVISATFPLTVPAQEAATPYEWPQDTLVRANLEKWRDQKFGMIIHWGLYAVPGIVESWSICNEEWITRDTTKTYEEYKRWYFGLNKDFNPVNFNPEQWAHAAKDAGMKYLVFTTKHHDGFCMFDTKETDFKITNGPFGGNPRANVAKYVFEAFRKEGFLVGAYFSKPDWHSENYWWPVNATADRNNNYDIRQYPWRWAKFKQFVYNQVSELTHDYGKLDILWLDGGWVRPAETINDEVRSWGHLTPWSQDIDMPKIATMARNAQPGLLIVDRTVHGPYENYRTPEQNIPSSKLDIPWESCITLGSDWGYVPKQNFKTAPVVIHKLVEIVAKGGSMLLGVGPKPDGTLPEEVISRLEEIGAWMKTNGEAIYSTRTMDHYSEQNIFFTQSRLTGQCYAIVCLKENELTPDVLEWSVNLPAKSSDVKCLLTGKKIKWTEKDGKIILTVPEEVRKTKNSYALVFSFKPIKG